MARLPLHLTGGTTGIGSLPHQLPEEALRLALLPDLPYWPQLPRRHANEGMLQQFAGSGAPLLPDRASGLYALAESLQGQRLPILKGQITGPITQSPDAASWTLAAERLAAKALWQLKWLQRWADEVLIVIDEPAIGRVGASDRSRALTAIDRLIRPLRAAGALVGVHCCGDADWEWLATVDWDVLSFDTALRPPLTVLARHVRAGGSLVWGVFPTDQEPDFTAAMRLLRERWDAGALPPETWYAAALISPACGLGLQPLAKAEKLVHATQRLATELRAERDLRSAWL